MVKTTTKVEIDEPLTLVFWDLADSLNRTLRVVCTCKLSNLGKAPKVLTVL